MIHAQTSTGFLGIRTDIPECFVCKHHCDEVLKNLRDRRDLCDVVLRTDDDSKRIRAHRLILIGSSQYFSTLLGSECQDREVTINYVDGEALEKLINYCYTGKLKFEGETIEALLTTANLLNLQNVVDGCCDFIQRHLTTSNCLAVAALAERQNIKPLLNSACDFIAENFTEVSNSPEFLLLNAKLLKAFITSDKLDVPSEEFLFDVITNWIDHEPEERRQHFTRILPLLRLHLMSPTFLSEKVEPLCYTRESQKMVSNALKTPLLDSTALKSQLPDSTAIKSQLQDSTALKSQLPDSTALKSQLPDSTTLKSQLPVSNVQTSHIATTSDREKQPKNQSKYLLAISEKSEEGKHYFRIQSYNLSASKWTSYNTKCRYRTCCTVALMDDNLIVVGGENSAKVTSINLITKDLTEMPPLVKKRWCHSLAVLNGMIYAIGGFDGNEDLNSVEKWDPGERAWTSVAPMKNARKHFGVCVVHGYLYASGGRNKDMRLASVECYDPVANSWTTRARMKVPRSSHSLAAHKGYLFAMGGYQNNTMERYNPHRDTWTLISYSPSFRKQHLTFADSLGPDLYICNSDKCYKISNESTGESVNLQELCKFDSSDLVEFLSYVGVLAD